MKIKEKTLKMILYGDLIKEKRKNRRLDKKRLCFLWDKNFF